MMCCAVMAEGCAEPMRKRLPQVRCSLAGALPFPAVQCIAVQDWPCTLPSPANTQGMLVLLPSSCCACSQPCKAARRSSTSAASADIHHLCFCLHLHLLPQLLPLLLAGLADPQGEVCGVAAFALGQFSEYLQPDILAHYQAVMPGVFSLLRDPDHDVQERACYGAFL